MKWSIAGLLLLGVGAAICASLLVASLKVVPPAVATTSTPPKEVQIIVANKPLKAMSIVDAQSVELKTVPADDAPENYMRRPSDVIGKLLTIPIVEGQVFTSNCFADEKSGARLASALAKGMRAVSVSLKPEKAGLLYPGCIVDVLVALNRPSTEGPGSKEAMSMTLLQNIEVLAIDDTSVMSAEVFADPPAPETNTTPIRRERRDRLVTLMVNSNQAKALQLASQYGTMSLALRNPLDSHVVETESTMLSDLADEYTRIVAALTPADTPNSDGTQPPGAAAPRQVAPSVPSEAVSLKDAREQRAEGNSLPGGGPAKPEKPEDPRFELMVNRNGQIELVRFRRESGSRPDSAAQYALRWIWESQETPTGGASAQAK